MYKDVFSIQFSGLSDSGGVVFTNLLTIFLFVCSLSIKSSISFSRVFISDIPRCKLLFLFRLLFIIDV